MLKHPLDHQKRKTLKAVLPTIPGPQKEIFFYKMVPQIEQQKICQETISCSLASRQRTV